MSNTNQEMEKASLVEEGTNNNNQGETMLQSNETVAVPASAPPQPLATAPATDETSSNKHHETSSSDGSCSSLTQSSTSGNENGSSTPDIPKHSQSGSCSSLTNSSGSDSPQKEATQQQGKEAKMVESPKKTKTESGPSETQPEAHETGSKSSGSCSSLTHSSVSGEKKPSIEKKEATNVEPAGAPSDDMEQPKESDSNYSAEESYSSISGTFHSGQDKQPEQSCAHTEPVAPPSPGSQEEEDEGESYLQGSNTCSSVTQPSDMDVGSPIGGADTPTDTFKPIVHPPPRYNNNNNNNNMNPGADVPPPLEKKSNQKNHKKNAGPRFTVLRKNDSNPLGSARSRVSSRKSGGDSSSESASIATCNSSSSSGNSTLSTRSHYQIFGLKLPIRGGGGGVTREAVSQSSRSSRLSRSSSTSSYFYRLGLGPLSEVGGFWLACSTLVVLLTIFTFVVARAATTSATSFLNSMSGPGPSVPLRVVVATRLHNRQATHALTDDAIRHKIREFADVCQMADAVQGIIAVDAEDTTLLKQVNKEIDGSSTPMVALPITPWGRFVPALNALIGYAAALEEMPDCILFSSAETSATRQSVQALLNQMLEHPMGTDVGGAFPRLRTSKLAPEPPKLDISTLVAGALLPGHDYQSKTERDGSDDEKAVQKVELNGRTTPWNTLAVWNLRKLATTGFLLLSEGFLTSTEEDPSYGVEEVVTIALLQKLLGQEEAVAKLVPVPGITWDAEFADPERQLWHQTKMESKLSRAARQMKIAKLEGVVHHY
eukprot:CAMPEP_0172452480 /NCGR_PEP_ID=MMETSP1065-20121228/10127_1 /TAXON_ID=265537 /ORGANISM="Amphiprora paludosa, Strain CCMP125" /LENGTH=771 /DNA_ID=CAMNT_0013204539 /DNA_START=114 /DNA_END=2429 /DNA_ORIENTATION=-